MRKGKMGRVAFALLLSVALIGANISFVYAEEESSSSSESSGSSSESGKSSSESSGSSSESGKSSSESGGSSSESGKSSSESGGSSSESSKSSSESGGSSSESGNSADKTAAGEEKTDGENASSKEESTEEKTPAEEGETSSEENTKETSTEAEKTGEEASSEDENAEENVSAGKETPAEGEVIETPGAEETPAEGEVLETPGAEETSETVFTNKDGEEVKPSSLVGTDYTTVAGQYDGETNVIKQYAASDEYGVNTIMESYVDENGNLVMVISQGSDVAAEAEMKETDSASKSGAAAPAVDGSFSGWDDIPTTYEYNWDNSQNCWNYGVWVDGEKYTTETGSYDTNVRHAMQMYSDGENVYLNITFAREFSTGQVANGNDYQFWIDGQMAAYQVEWSDGSSLSNSSAAPGTYQVDVRHRDSSWSYVLTDGAVAYYHVNEGNVNNQLELKIPLSEFQKQNGNINLDNYNMIQFYTPNLMYNRISAAGSPTGAVPFAAAAFLLVPAGYVWLKEKENKGVSFA